MMIMIFVKKNIHRVKEENREAPLRPIVHKGCTGDSALSQHHCCLPTGEHPVRTRLHPRLERPLTRDFVGKNTLLIIKILV